MLRPRQKGSLTDRRRHRHRHGRPRRAHGLPVRRVRRRSRRASAPSPARPRTSRGARRASRGSRSSPCSRPPSAPSACATRSRTSAWSRRSATCRREIRDFDLERLAREARAEWNAALGKIEVEGGTEAQKTVFYTALYRAHERMVRISEDGRYLQRLGRPRARRRGRAVLDGRLELGHLPRPAPAERAAQPRRAAREARVVRARLRAVGLDADVPDRGRRRALHERPAPGGPVRRRVGQGHPRLRPRARLRLPEEDASPGRA